MFDAIRNHWPEYLIEAWCLGTFMVSACAFGTLLFSPASPVIDLPFAVRNTLMGLAMGATAVAIITSPWGKRSGAHFNPAVTLAFLRLGRIGVADTCFYILFHFIGGVAGVVLSRLLLGDLLAESAVNFVVTVPGSLGVGAAFVAEGLIAFAMMTTILFTSDNARTAHLTPLIAGSLLAFSIAVESPVSGMSINPARTFASAIVAGEWSGWWIYFVAPTIAMMAAAEFFLLVRGLSKLATEGTDRGAVITAETQRRRGGKQDGPSVQEEEQLSVSATLQ